MDEVIVDINAIRGLVLRQRQGLIAASKHYELIVAKVSFFLPDSGLPLHPLDQILGVLAIADAEYAWPSQGNTLAQ